MDLKRYLRDGVVADEALLRQLCRHLIRQGYDVDETIFWYRAKNRPHYLEDCGYYVCPFELDLEEREWIGRLRMNNYRMVPATEIPIGGLERGVWLPLALASWVYYAGEERPMGPSARMREAILAALNGFEEWVLETPRGKFQAEWRYRGTRKTYEQYFDTAGLAATFSYSQLRRICKQLQIPCDRPTETYQIEYWGA